MNKLIFPILVLVALSASGFSKRNIVTKEYPVKAFYADLDKPYRTPPRSARDTMTFEYDNFLYFKQKDSAIDLEYYALFSKDIFEFFRGEASFQPLQNNQTAKLNSAEPVLIRYNGQYYPLKTDITLPHQSLPARLHYRLTGGFVYLLIEANILSMNPPTPVGFCYIFLKFKNKQLLKQHQFYSADKVDFGQYIKNR